MEKTAYQKYLERIRHKITGKAEEAILNQDDPSRFQPLQAIYSNPKVRKRLDLLTWLYGLESKTEKEPIDAWLAILWSGQARIPTPLWAVQMFETIGNARLYDHDNPNARSLDKAFGFGAGRGETPPVLKRLIHVRQDELFRGVWILTLLGYDDQTACKMVARRYQRNRDEKDNVPYRWRLGRGKKSGLGEYLRQHYNEWRETNEIFIKQAEPDWRARLSISLNRVEYLQLFLSRSEALKRVSRERAK